MSDGAEGHRGVYSIGAVARLLGLPAATIRNWEDRYETVVPERSAGGQRLYSRAQVEQLRYVAAQVARGFSAADAHRLLSELEAAGSPPAADEPGDRPLVLIAECDAAAAAVAEAVLRGDGFEVDLVLSADEAEARWLERRPRLAIVELMVSGGDGAALCRRLKRHDDAARLLVSSALQARDVALRAGADAFLQKPVDPVTLVRTVHELLAPAPRAVA